MVRDPYLEREKQRYANPIASRELILDTIKKIGKPQTAQQLAAKLNLHTPEQLVALGRRLHAMEVEGQVARNRRDAFGLISHMDLRIGVVRGNKDGSGMCILENGDAPLYLSNLQMQRVFDGDRVVVSPRIRLPEGDQECVISDILQRNTQTLIGTLVVGRDATFVEPRNKRIRHRIVVKSVSPDIPRGALVEVDITQQPSRHIPPEGRVVGNLSSPHNQLNEIQIALRTHNLATDWPDAVIAEAQSLPAIATDTTYTDREDLRSLAFVTIDGNDSRDFDDAIYCEKRKGGGYRLLVAIADVSHYVAIGSELDQCALHRSNSVYFPRQVVPMLPERLSNDLCSLNPRVDRLVMVCEMHLSKSGECKDYWLYQGVMRSHARLTYDEVNAWFEGNPLKADNQDAPIHANLTQLQHCYTHLENRRKKRGALTFDIPEYVLSFSPQSTTAGRIATHDINGIVPVMRGVAQKLIEEMMVLANCCVAQLLHEHKIPTLYRVHATPDSEKIEKFRRFLYTTMGIKLTGGSKPKPSDFTKVLDKTKEHPLGEYLFPLVLRTMQQAVYTPSNEGHYGLALTHYCHFTSPIRRYPDLLVHRGIKALLRTAKKSPHLKPLVKKERGVSLSQLYPYTKGAMQSIGLQCSVNEHKAAEASSDVFSYLSCIYLEQFVGEQVDGVVKSITSFGLFVGIGDTNVDGLIHISNLDNDYYHFEADSLSLVGEQTQKRYTLGDKLRVIISAVDKDKKRIDLLLVNPAHKKKHSKNRAGKRQGGKRAKAQRRSRSH